MKCILLLIFLDMLICTSKGKVTLNKIRQWKKLDFKFPTKAARNEALTSQKWIPEHPFPIDVDVDYKKSRIFVTVPRFSEGIPITLGYVSFRSNDLQITPYPDYSWHSHQGSNCDKITSPLRVAIDECNQLWVLDSGKMYDDQKCPPQIFIFNLETDKLVRNYKFPTSQYTIPSLFINPILDVEKSSKCQNTKVYIADVDRGSLIVYDYKTNQSWKIQNSLFVAEQDFIDFTIAGESFDLTDGLFGLAISPRSFNQSDRVLYFHGLASDKENAVPLDLVNNQNLWVNDPYAESNSFITLGSRGTQTAAEAMDRNGNLYFVLMNPLAVACWDSSTPYNRDNIKVILQNDVTLQFASGVKVIKNLDGEEELWLMTVRLQKIYNGSMNYNETNFRILSQNIKALLKGRNKCNGVPLSHYRYRK